MELNGHKKNSFYPRQTPADKAGIEIKGKNKWLVLIQNASKVNEDKNQIQ